MENLDFFYTNPRQLITVEFEHISSWRHKLKFTALISNPLKYVFTVSRISLPIPL